jgi:hypothetical protein
MRAGWPSALNSAAFVSDRGMLGPVGVEVDGTTRARTPVRLRLGLIV